MRAHVFITDENTFPSVRDNGFWGVGVNGIPNAIDQVVEENLRNGRKPYFSMIADIFGTRLGDLVFLYERQVGFHGAYKVASEPFFDPTLVGHVDSTWPIRVEIECLNYFPNPVPEDYLFSTKEYESKFWAWFYRKIQGASWYTSVDNRCHPSHGDTRKTCHPHRGRNDISEDGDTDRERKDQEAVRTKLLKPAGSNSRAND